MTATEIRCPFTEEEAIAAHDEWGCNCGPAALAFTLGITLDAVRPFVEAAGFCRAKNYMSPTMMQRALGAARACWCVKDLRGILLPAMQFPDLGLARIQWLGPWTMAGANPKWAYRATHWVASRRLDLKRLAERLNPVIFDVNGGMMRLREWEEEIVPLITKSIPRADGEWRITHSWEL